MNEVRNRVLGRLGPYLTIDRPNKRKLLPASPIESIHKCVSFVNTISETGTLIYQSTCKRLKFVYFFSTSAAEGLYIA